MSKVPSQIPYYVMSTICIVFPKANLTHIRLTYQRELFLLEVSNRETKVAIEANNNTYCFQNE